MPLNIMKRLSKSATDLSSCTKKTRSTSDEDFGKDKEDFAHAQISDDDNERPASSQSSRSVPAISLIGARHSRGNSRRSITNSLRSRSQSRDPHEQSIAAEIAAVQKSANFGLFGLLRQKFSRTGGGKEVAGKPQPTPDLCGRQLLAGLNGERRESTPEVIRIRCEAADIAAALNYNADTESGGTPSPKRKPHVTRQTVEYDGNPRADGPRVVRHQNSEDTASTTSTASFVQSSAPLTTPSKVPNLEDRQESHSSFVSILSQSRTVSLDKSHESPRGTPPPSVEEEKPNMETYHSVQDLKTYSQYSVTVHLKQGHDLAAKDSCGTSDPYVKFFLNNKLLYKSKTIYKDLNPFWDEHFNITAHDLSTPLEIKVYDYDWGLRDDFMGQATMDLTKLKVNDTTDLVLTLAETGKSEYLGQVSVSLQLVPKDLEDRPETPEVSAHPVQAVQSAAEKALELAARKLKPGTWAAVVNIVLVQGKDLLAMDLEGTSDPYCKFRLGNDRYKSRTVYESLNPRWLEQFELYLYDDFGLDITVWDKDQRSKDDFMGRSSMDLSQLKKEVSHELWVNLEDGAGKLLLVVTVSGTTSPSEPTFLGNFDHSERTLSLRRDLYKFSRSWRNLDDVGHLIVKVFRAKGLVSADLGGKSDPYCVLELDNARVQTQTEYKTIDPEWHKVFSLAVKDIHSVLHVSVYDEDKHHKSEFLGKIAIPLLKIKNNVKCWFALKDRKLRCRAKGTCPQILLEFDFVYNSVKAAITTLNPKDEIHMQFTEKFKRQIFINNVMRIKAVIMDVIDFGQFIQSCLEWESTTRSILAFFIFMTISYYFEPYMAPVGLLLIFIKHYIVISYIEPRPVDREEATYMSEDEDDIDEKDEDKEEKKSLKERLQAIQDVTAMVQNALGYVASLAEGVKNTFNFSVPFLSWLAIIILSTITIVLYFIPLRVLIMGWGINKFAKKLIRPDTITNNEVMDFLSRVPDDETLVDCRELRLNNEANPPARRTNAKKKHKQS